MTVQAQKALNGSDSWFFLVMKVVKGHSQEQTAGEDVSAKKRVRAF